MSLGQYSLEQSHIAVALERFDGGLHYEDTFVGLKLAELQSVDAPGHGKILVFAKDAEGRYLCLKGNVAAETVLIFDPNEGSVDEDLGMNYGQYLESLRDKLLLKKIAYEDGLGMVSFA